MWIPPWYSKSCFTSQPGSATMKTLIFLLPLIPPPLRTRQEKWEVFLSDDVLCSHSLRDREWWRQKLLLSKRMKPGWQPVSACFSNGCREKTRTRGPATAHIKLHRVGGSFGVCVPRGRSWGEEYRWLCKKALQVKPQKGEKDKNRNREQGQWMENSDKYGGY